MEPYIRMSDKDPVSARPSSQRPVTGTPKSRITTALVVIFICLAIILLGTVAVVIYFSVSSTSTQIQSPVCSDPCILTLVESIPENLTYAAGSPAHPSTYDGLMELMSAATETIEIASFYWTLRGQDIPHSDDSAWQGESVFDTLLKAGKERHLKIRIAQNQPEAAKPNTDTEYLGKEAGAQVRSLNFTRLMGSGILHTKLWLIDRKHFYVGSANLDWRSLTQVKELGAVVFNCSCMARDMGKLFDAYWYLGDPKVNVPYTWPQDYTTHISNNTPMAVSYNNTPVTSYLSSSPPPFCASGRTVDIDAIVSVIRQAEKFIYIAVMDYFPTTQFIRPRIYWPVIDDELRKAAFDRHIEVKLLASCWQYTWKENFAYLRSLDDLHYSDRYFKIDMQVKMFVVPVETEAQQKIDHIRVNHNKYMVTDKTAYIGTSNWSGDYFIDTGGIGLIVNQPAVGSQDGHVRQQLEDIFHRDWDSQYSYFLRNLNKDICSAV